jgi:hypothetical protein
VLGFHIADVNFCFKYAILDFKLNIWRVSSLQRVTKILARIDSNVMLFGGIIDISCVSFLTFPYFYSVSNTAEKQWLGSLLGNLR